MRSERSPREFKERHENGVEETDSDNMKPRGMNGVDY